MRSLPLATALSVLATATFAAAPPALAKEGVKATLTSAVPLNAAPGTTLKVSWRLFHVHEDGRRPPFGASGVFVRLHSATGEAAEEAFAPARVGSAGTYSTTVVVPDGGIGDIEIGLMGWQSGPSGTKRADMRFPITNDPLPRALEAATERSAKRGRETPGRGSLLWGGIAAVGGLALAAAVGALVFRTRSAARPAPWRRKSA